MSNLNIGVFYFTGSGKIDYSRDKEIDPYKIEGIYKTTSDHIWYLQFMPGMQESCYTNTANVIHIFESIFEKEKLDKPLFTNCLNPK
jgi:hypothetical protein